MQKQRTLNKLFLATIATLIVTFSFLGLGVDFNYEKNTKIYAESATETTAKYGEYLSNLTPITQTIGYGSLKLDKNIDNKSISLIVGGERKYFEKGLVAHATSTLVYDFGINHPYDYFYTYIGVDASQAGKGNVKFSVYTSNDNENWTTALEPTAKTSSDEAIILNISIKNIRYLKFYFDSNGVNHNDHSGLGDCKLFTDGYTFDKDEDLIKPVEYYNNLFASKTTQEILNNYELELMQRKFIDTIGYGTLKNSFLLGEYEQERRQMLNWLLNDSTALKDFVTGGTPNGGSYINALKILTKLYRLYSTDLNDTTELFAPEEGSTRNRGDVYRTMMIAIALTNARDVYGWVNSGDILDPYTRYEAYKYTYLAQDYHLRYDIFENLCVEEMRYLMSSRINSEEIYWLNAYATIKYLAKNSTIQYPSVYSPHSHIKYGRDWNYASKGYYEEENFEQYNQKYMLEQFGVSLTTTPRLWMAMDGSQICWGISYLGTNFASAFGVPSHYVRQPDHAAFLVYNKDANGRTIWTIDNDIFGWTKTWMNEDTVGHGNNRMMCDWGTTGSEQVTHYNSTYILLSATALDNQSNYEKAELALSLKNITPVTEQENLFRYTLSIMPYHLDAWLELVKLYINTDKSDDELANLAEEIAQNMYCFPLPMHELIALIKIELNARNTDSSLTQLAKVRNTDNIALQKATNVNNDETAKNLIAQTAPCVQEAKYLLGLIEEEKLATFSFDGENKNKLVFNSNYTNVRYKYSIDGGTTWSESLVTSVDNITHELTTNEIDNISSANDIYIWLEGWGTTIDLTKAFKIDILDGVEVSTLEQNDNENRFFGTFTNIEYSLDMTIWQDLSEDSVFSGNQSIYVRHKKYNTTLQGPATTFEFIDNYNSVRNYIPISSIQLFDYSSEETSRSNDSAKHAIDGKLSTRWHTSWSGGDNDRYITVKLDSSRYISGFDYTPVGGNGTMLACNIYISQDGENWTLATSVSGWGNNTIKKSLTFTPVYGQYIKVVGTNTIKGFCSARLLEFFEDTTLINKQIIGMNIVTLPNQDVYIINQKINYNGMKAQLIFEDNTFAVIPNELLMLNEITFTEIGIKEIEIKYNETIKTSFTVKVIDVSDSVALVGENYFSSLEDAIESIDTVGTIKLLKNVIVSSGYTISKTITIDGNNHRLERSNEWLSAIFTVSQSGSLTLNNITIDGGAVWDGDINHILGRGITNSGIIANGQLIKMSDNAVLTLNNCMLINNYNNYSTNAQGTGGAIFLGNKACATLSNTTIQNCYSYLFGSAIYTRDNSKLTINSGSFLSNSGNSGRNTTVICVDNSSTCVVNGGEFCNNLAYTKGGVFWIANGSLDINGGTFKNNYATIGAGIYLNGNAKVNIANFEEIGDIYIPSGKNIYIFGALSNKTLNITMANNADDTIVAICEDENLIYKVLKSINVTNKLLYVDEINIKISNTNTAKVSIQNNDKETLFTSLEQAIFCSEQYDTITLKEDVTLNQEICIKHPLTIDFSSFSVSGVENIKVIDTYCSKKDNNLLKIQEHIYNLNITYSWSDDNTTCTAKGVCECGDEYTETVSTTEQITLGTHTGEQTVTRVCTFEYDYFTNQEKIISQITKEHIYNLNITYSWSDDNTTCTAKGVCECGDEYTETVSTTKIITTEASYDNQEISTFKAKFEFNKFIDQEKPNIVTGDCLIKPHTEDDSTNDTTEDDKNENTNIRAENNLIIILLISVDIIILITLSLLIIFKIKKNKKIKK